MESRKSGVGSREPRLVLLGLALVLAGCGGNVSHVDDRTPVTRAEPAAAATTPERKPAVVQKRGGAYYKDDGPADEIPENLDDIPDALPRLEPLHRFANRPYNVLGKSYVPDSHLKPFRQRGIASWYGKKFHGQKTSIGEPYDMFAMTAAHPTLAIPSYVRVTNPANGRNVVVRVTDRGPFHADRVIDLSYAAAHRLGYVNNGSTLVEIESIIPTDATTLTYAHLKPPAAPVIPEKQAGSGGQRDELELLGSRLASEPAPPPSKQAAQPTPSGLFLQLGAFSSNDNAESLRSHLTRDLDWLNEKIVVAASGNLFRVQVGPYPNRTDAEKVAERIRQSHGYKPAFVVR